MDRYTIILNDLQEIEPYDPMVIPPPYDDGLSDENKVRITYQVLQRTNITTDRLTTLINAYYLGKLLESVSHDRARKRYYEQLLTEHYRVMCKRTYLLFELLGPEQLLRTKRTTASMIRSTNAPDFKRLLIEATTLATL